MTRLHRRDFTTLLLALTSASVLSSESVFAREHASLPEYMGPWVPLFNGRDLDGWSFYQDGIGSVDSTDSVVAENGMIHVLGPRYRGGSRPGFGHIATTREFRDYHLRFEYRFGERRYEPRLLAKRNSGVLYHMFPQTDRVWPNAVELQLEESDLGDAILINARCWPGSDVGGTPAWPEQIPIESRPVFAPPVEPRPALERQRVIKNGDFERRGDWNTVELLAIGDRAAHLINGRIVTTLFELEAQDVEDRNNYRPLTSGRIGLEIECAEAMFRNIQIRPFAVT